MGLQPQTGADDARDLVVIALPGVQKLISEAQSTADVRAGSEIVTRLTSVAATAARDNGGTLIIPATPNHADGMPNRVVVLAPPGAGPALAAGAAAAVRTKWKSLVKAAVPASSGAPHPPPTPGVPQVQWVCVADRGRGYPWQWVRAQELLAARRRIRDFPAVEWAGRRICSLSPRWPAEDTQGWNLRSHEVATLSAANWVKRTWQKANNNQRFPSTPSIASAPFRQAVLAVADDEVREIISDLHNAVRRLNLPGEAPVAGLPVPPDPLLQWFVRSAGPWVYLERWQAEALVGLTDVSEDVVSAAAKAGVRALARLYTLLHDKHEIGRPSDYLAVIVQDLDGMGRFLSGEGVSTAGDTLTLNPHNHAMVSAELGRLAVRQREVLRSHELLGVPVYAGGDDLLTFVPGPSALTAAQQCHDLVPASLPTVSTAVLYFHYHYGMQTALALVRRLLEHAKAVPGKHGLAVGFLRRSGTSMWSVQPWTTGDGSSTADRFGIFARNAEQSLSPRLIGDLERDNRELAALFQRDQRLYQAELARLVRRHLANKGPGSRTGVHEVASALMELGRSEHGGEGPVTHPRPERAGRVGVFLRQEATT